jgi:acyl carrier protein
MSNKFHKYKDAFIQSFNLEDGFSVEKLEFNAVPEWDSIGHMTLIATLEDGFGISFETDDIVDFSSFSKGIEILKKYQISLIE